MTAVTMVSRAEWHARPAKGKTAEPSVAETYLHHTVGYGAGGAAYMRQVQDQHMAKGWTDIAYNFVVDPQTLIVYEGRGWGIRPGSQKGHNARTWSVAVMGNYSNRTASPALTLVIANLMHLGNRLGFLPPWLTGGHRDAPGQSTSCPGRLTEAIPRINDLLAPPPTDGETMEQIPLEDWARNSFAWAIENRIYTQQTNLAKIRETYDFQRQIVNMHRYHLNLGARTPTGSTIDIRVLGEVL